MKILIACEFNGTVRDAFRRKGHHAWSCDLLPTEGEFTQFHYQANVLDVLRKRKFDMMIAHPPCTYLNIAANRWLKAKMVVLDSMLEVEAEKLELNKK